MQEREAQARQREVVILKTNYESRLEQIAVLTRQIHAISKEAEWKAQDLDAKSSEDFEKILKMLDPAQ